MRPVIHCCFARAAGFRRRRATGTSRSPGGAAAGRDPREDLPQPFFKKGVLKLEDLEVGMELHGAVLNVVDFGAFVDIGMHDSGLVHVSQLSSQFVRDPHDVVSVGQIVPVWVLEVDKGRRRVALTMIDPARARQGRPGGGRGPQTPGVQPNEAGERRSGGRRQARPPRAAARSVQREGVPGWMKSGYPWTEIRS